MAEETSERNEWTPRDAAILARLASAPQGIAEIQMERLANAAEAIVGLLERIAIAQERIADDDPLTMLARLDQTLAAEKQGAAPTTPRPPEDDSSWAMAWKPNG